MKTKGFEFYEIKYGKIDWSFLNKLPWQLNLGAWCAGRPYDWSGDEKFGEVLMTCVNEGNRLDARRYVEGLFRFGDDYIFDMTSKTRRVDDHTMKDDGSLVDVNGKKCGAWDRNIDSFIRKVGSLNAFV